MTARPRPSSTRRPPLDLSLYLVTDTALCGAAGVAATVRSAVAAGVTVVQLRDHAATDGELVRLGREVRAVLAGTGVPLLVNDRVHLVAAIGADGAHVGQQDLPAVEARRVLGPHRYLGLTVRTVAHVRAAARDLDAVDYLGVGPVRATTSKPDHAAPIGPEGVRAVVDESPWPCVAIGGITADHLPTLRSTGVDGVAVVSAVCGTADVAGATRTLRRGWSGNGTGTRTDAPPTEEPT